MILDAVFGCEKNMMHLGWQPALFPQTHPCIHHKKTTLDGMETEIAVGLSRVDKYTE
jgi:hypothetical protein